MQKQIPAHSGSCRFLHKPFFKSASIATLSLFFALHTGCMAQTQIKNINSISVHPPMATPAPLLKNQDSKTQEPKTQDQLGILLSTLRISDVSALASQILHSNPYDYPKEYFEQKRVVDFFSWLKKNNVRLTSEINSLLKKNRLLFKEIISLQNERNSPHPANLTDLFRLAQIPPSDSSGRLIMRSAHYCTLLERAVLGLIGTYLGQEYIISRYLKPNEIKNRPSLEFFGERTAYYSPPNVIGLALPSLISGQRRNLDDASFFLVCLYLGGHEGAHGLSVIAGRSYNSLGELATYMAGAEHFLPIKLSEYTSLLNIPLIMREMEKPGENSIVSTPDLWRFYVVHCMGPWINSWFKEEKKQADIFAFEVGSLSHKETGNEQNGARFYKALTIEDLHDLYNSGALNSRIDLEARAFCLNSGIKDEALIQKITQVFEELKRTLDSDDSIDTYRALIEALNTVFGEPELPEGVLDTFGAVYRKNEISSNEFS